MVDLSKAISTTWYDTTILTCAQKTHCSDWLLTKGYGGSAGTGSVPQEKGPETLISKTPFKCMSLSQK